MNLLSTPARLLTALLYLAAAVAVFFCTAELCHWLRIDRCPADSFLSRISLQAFVVMALPLAVAFGGTLALAIDAAAAGNYLADNRALAGIPAIAAILVLPAFLWIGLGNELCLSPGGITLRASQLSPVRAYAWQNVQTLAVSCYTAGRRHSSHHNGATLWMADGRKISITEHEYLRIHSQLGDALAPTDYRFGPPFIDDTCPAADRAIFSARP